VAAKVPFKDAQSNMVVRMSGVKTSAALRIAMTAMPFRMRYNLAVIGVSTGFGQLTILL
jgi:hypothetical protein